MSLLAMYDILRDAKIGALPRNAYSKELIQELKLSGYLEASGLALTQKGKDALSVMQELCDIGEGAYRKEHNIPLPRV